MLFTVRQKIERRWPIDPNNRDLHLKSQLLINKYLMMGRTYGLNYGRKIGVMKD